MTPAQAHGTLAANDRAVALSHTPATDGALRLERPRFWAPLGLALALGILNPVACLIYCAPPHAEWHTELHGEFFGFLCRVPPRPECAAVPLLPPPRAA